MSLINEALRRARTQAALQQAAQQMDAAGIALQHPPSRSLTPIVGICLAAAALGAVGVLIVSQVLRTAPPPALPSADGAAAAARTSGSATDPGSQSHTSPPSITVSDASAPATEATTIDPEPNPPPAAGAAVSTAQTLPTEADLEPDAAVPALPEPATDRPQPPVPLGAPISTAATASAEPVSSPDQVEAPPPQVPAVPQSPPDLVEGQEFMETMQVNGLPKLSLLGISWSDTVSAVLINGRILRRGDTIGGKVKVLKIEPDRVQLEARGTTFYLVMP